MVNHLCFIFLVSESLTSLDCVFFRSCFNRESMVWTEQHNILFLKEILHSQPWIYHHESAERGQTWGEIAPFKNSLEEPFFKVTPRSVCDRYSLLVKKYKLKLREEDKASRIAPNYTQIDKTLLDLTE